MAALKVIPPVLITDSTLTSSNVAETDYAVWSSGTTYSTGQRVIVTTGVHKIYESLQGSNLNKDPTAASSATWWLEVSPTNRWKMFDTSNTTRTTNANSIVVTITPGKVINSVALLELKAQSITIKMTDPIDGVVYNKTFSLLYSGTINNWWNYYFNPISRKTSIVVTDLPAYGTAAVEITITNTGGTAECGVCQVGASIPVGEGINLGASVGIMDYSIKKKDDFGNFIVVPRSYSKRAKFSMAIVNEQIDSVLDLLASLRTTPCIWIGDENYQCTVVYGYYKDFDIVIAYHLVSDCNLEIEGLV